LLLNLLVEFDFLVVGRIIFAVKPSERFIKTSTSTTTSSIAATASTSAVEATASTTWSSSATASRFEAATTTGAAFTTFFYSVAAFALGSPSKIAVLTRRTCPVPFASFELSFTSRSACSWCSIFTGIAAFALGSPCKVVVLARHANPVPFACLKLLLITTERVVSLVTKLLEVTAAAAVSVKLWLSTKPAFIVSKILFMVQQKFMKRKRGEKC
jgi:hypothetical protein